MIIETFLFYFLSSIFSNFYSDFLLVPDSSHHYVSQMVQSQSKHSKLDYIFLDAILRQQFSL